MNCCQNNMSMTSTRNNNVSMFIRYMDTFSERVHAVDMKERSQSAMTLDAEINTKLQEIRYGG